MTNLNSSGSCERFTLASGEDKTFFTTTGANHMDVEVKGDDQAAASVSIKTQTSEDNVSWTDKDTVTVVPSGYGYASTLVGKYCRVLSSSGDDEVHIVCRLRNTAQVIPRL